MLDILLLPIVLLFSLSLGFGLKTLYDYRMEKRYLLDNLHQITETEVAVRQKKKRRKAIIDKIIWLADDLSEIGTKIQVLSETKEVEKWIVKAGKPHNMTVARFHGLKVALFVIGFFLGFIWLIIGLPFRQVAMVLLPFIGYLYPIFWIKSAAKKRQEEIRLSLPDFLDMMSITLAVGLGFDQALKKILPYFEGALTEEFNRFLQEVKFGVERKEALRNLLERNDCPELQILVKALLQGMQLGVPMSATFKHQAEDMRIMQQERVKELSAKTSPKITLITTFFIAPTAIIMIVGLMIMNIIFGENGISSMFNF